MSGQAMMGQCSVPIFCRVQQLLFWKSLRLPSHAGATIKHSRAARRRVESTSLPRTAKDAALSYLKTLFDNASAWRVNEIKLVPLSERWVYVVSFTPPLPRDCQDCMTTSFSVVVTMDGSPITAVVSRWEPPTPSVYE